MSLDNTNPEASEVPTSPSPSPSSGCEAVEVTGVLAVTAFSATKDFDPEWSVSKVAHDLHSHLSDSAQRLFDLNSPVGLRGLDIYKCKFCTNHSSRLSCSLTYHIYTAATSSVQIPGGLKKPVTGVKVDGEEVTKYLIMFDLPSDDANIVETYVNDNKENLAVARGESLVREEEVELAKKNKKKGKGKKKDNAGKCLNPVSPLTI